MCIRLVSSILYGMDTLCFTPSNVPLCPTDAARIENGIYMSPTMLAERAFACAVPSAATMMRTAFKTGLLIGRSATSPQQGQPDSQPYAPLAGETLPADRTVAENNAGLDRIWRKLGGTLVTLALALTAGAIQVQTAELGVLRNSSRIVTNVIDVTAGPVISAGDGTSVPDFTRTYVEWFIYHPGMFGDWTFSQTGDTQDDGQGNLSYEYALTSNGVQVASYLGADAEAGPFDFWFGNGRVTVSGRYAGPYGMLRLGDIERLLGSGLGLDRYGRIALQGVDMVPAANGLLQGPGVWVPSMGPTGSLSWGPLTNLLDNETFEEGVDGKIRLKGGSTWSRSSRAPWTWDAETGRFRSAYMQICRRVVPVPQDRIIEVNFVSGTWATNTYYSMVDGVYYIAVDNVERVPVLSVRRAELNQDEYDQTGAAWEAWLPRSTDAVTYLYVATLAGGVQTDGIYSMPMLMLWE